MIEFDFSLMTSQCVLGKSRGAARAVSRFYGKLLEPHGLTSPQVHLMFVLAGSKAGSISSLAEVTGIERSGLNRNLNVLEKTGFVECEIGGRGGAKAYRLSPEGKAKLIELVPIWEEAQRRVREQLGEQGWDQMQKALRALSEL